MGAYIINVPDTVDTIIYVNIGDVYDGKTYIASQRVEDLTPYTEPDLEQVRKEAYEAGVKSSAVVIADDKAHEAYKLGYENGLNDAWDAARKIVDLWRDIPNDELMKIFDVRGNWGESVLSLIMRCLPPSEAIEKIRQYEQEKEEQITKGDVIRIKSTPEIEILVTYADEEYVSGIALTEVDGNCEIGDQYTDIRISNVEKTGKHYDIVSVLQKMREESNG